MAYNKHKWETGELITADKMNAIENGLDNANLIECDFKGRTKYLKGIDIDASTGIGTLKFYNGSDERGNSEVRFFTLDSANSSTDGQSEFFTQAQGERYIDQKMDNEYIAEKFPEALYLYLANELTEDEKTNKKFLVPKRIIDEGLATKLDKTSMVGENEEIDWAGSKLIPAKEIDGKIDNKISSFKLSLDDELEQKITDLNEKISDLNDRISSIMNITQLWIGTKYVRNDEIDIPDISNYNYLDFYIEHRTGSNKATVYTYRIPEEISTTGDYFTIRNSNIHNPISAAGNDSPASLEISEMQLNIKKNKITITQNQSMAWSGKKGDDAVWRQITAPSTDIDGVIKIKRIIARDRLHRINIIEEVNNDSNN